MSQLPEHVSDQEIEDMFKFADRDEDGKIGWEEFLLMITPVKMVEAEKPRLMKPAVRIAEETNCEAENTKKKVTLACKSVENIRAVEYSRPEGEMFDNREDQPGDLEMVMRTETEEDDSANINSHHDMEQSEVAETRADQTVVDLDDVGTKDGSSQSGGVEIF